MMLVVELKDRLNAYEIICARCGWICLATNSTSQEAQRVSDAHDCAHPGPELSVGSLATVRGIAQRKAQMKLRDAMARRRPSTRDTPPPVDA